MAEEPIACTLTGGDYTARVAWIADVMRDGLLEHTARDGAIELRFSLAVADRVRELVRREQACCAFLSFDLVESADGLRLTIAVPARARDAAPDLLAPFFPPADLRSFR